MEFVNMTKDGLIHWEYENPPKFESYWFEKVDGNELRRFTIRSLPFVGIIVSLYFLLVWLGPKWMKNRQPYNLDKPLIVWNFCMSLFSLTVCVRLMPEFLELLTQPNGWYKSSCLLKELHHSTTFWAFLFVFSKIVELGDTVFIVLRKKPLIMLHWFHHFSMLWISLFEYIQGEPCMIRHVVFVNSFVHTFMYAYFGCKGLQMKFPKAVPMMITTLQISQFVSGLWGTGQQLFYYRAIGKACVRTQTSVTMTTILGFSYLFLFTHLFYKLYIAKPKEKAA